MAGETFDEDRQGAPDEFLSHPKWHRFLVAMAGPSMNIMLAIAILTFSYLDGMYVPRYPKEAPIVGPVVANSIARRAGLQTGDRVISVNGNEVKTWEEMEIALATAPKDDLNAVVVRGSEQIRLRFDPPEGNMADPAALGFKFSIPQTVVAAVDPDSPAQAAGLQTADRILSVSGGGKVGRSYDEILNIISESKGVPLQFEISRPDQPRKPGESGPPAGIETAQAGQSMRLTITPIENKGRVIIGFVPEIPADLEKFGLLGAVTQSIRRNYEMSALTFKIIGRIFTGSASVKTISGPLEIARMSGGAARTGSARVFFGFLGLVSLQLGVFNLLPIPILDGGVIALLLIESVIGRDLSLGIKEKIVQVGFVFLILLMGFVVFNDLSKIVDFEKIFR
jgi:regulator of sigma E protease